jgi:hypothetical protein
MSKRKNYGKRENAHPLTCPHCGAGADGTTLCLCWEACENCWRCVICGYRKYEIRTETAAEIAADRMWDEVLGEIERMETGSLLVECGEPSPIP